MHNISDEQVEYILHDIEKKGITTEDVRYNFLDHICCIIEHEMPDGGNFYKFYEDTLKRFFTRDLSEIEEETQNLLKFKDYYAMKTTLKISIALVVLVVVLKNRNNIRSTAKTDLPPKLGGLESITVIPPSFSTSNTLLSPKDKKLENRYKSMMSANNKVPEIMPGGREGAIGETTSV